MKKQINITPPERVTIHDREDILKAIELGNEILKMLEDAVAQVEQERKEKK